jgi:hypothetical protein
MSLIEHLMEAARHLKEAMPLVVDWRVRDAVANAGTIVSCAVHLQQRIVDGKTVVEREPTGERTEDRTGSRCVGASERGA